MNTPNNQGKGARLQNDPRLSPQMQTQTQFSLCNFKAIKYNFIKGIELKNNL